MLELQELLRRLAKARRQMQISAGIVAAVRAQWERDHAHHLNSLELNKHAVATLEADIREAARQEYRASGDKKPADGVGIRVLTRLVYDHGDALHWAKSHDMALTLDVKAFEKIAKADPPEFVRITEEPQATIASDLTQYLADEESPST